MFSQTVGQGKEKKREKKKKKQERFGTTISLTICTLVYIYDWLKHRSTYMNDTATLTLILSISPPNHHTQLQLSIYCIIPTYSYVQYLQHYLVTT